MQTDTNREAQLRAARQLALHLRQTPEDAQKPPEELARQFGLPATFVSDVISGVQGLNRKTEPWFPKIDLSIFVRIYHALDRFFERLISNPVLFVLATTVLAIVVGFFANAAGAVQIGPRRAGASSGVTVNSLFVLVTVLTIFGLHMVTFYKKRMIRYALLSGLAIWVVLSCLTMVTIWLGMKDDPQAQGMTTAVLLLVALGILVVCSLYSAIGSGAAVLGAYIDLLRGKLREDRMSRQDLLEHYFELQERLDASQGLEPQPGIFDTDFVKALINTGPLWALLTGLVINSIMIITAIAAGPEVGPRAQLSWAVYAQLILVGLTPLAYILGGFFAKNFWYAIVQSLSITVGGIPPIIAGIHFFKLSRMENSLGILPLVATALGYVVISLFGALGGLVQRRASKELNLAQNDPAAILAEMVRIQWRLSDRRSHICVMVVDAAKSSEMKSYADPLAVEYSFREYQNLLTSLSGVVRGRVHSTAGDGAVIAFESAQEAFSAAKRIQFDIERFNREDNRLQLPFRLRIGLHMGEIVGDLNEVEFTEVIDIAAHVQAAAPVGGIAVTEEVSDHLPMEEFIPLARQIDGQNVLLALNPTVDSPWQTFST